MPSLVDLAEWRALEAHAATIEPVHLRDLFAADPGARRPHAPRGGGLVRRLRQAPRHRRDAGAARTRSPTRVTCAARIDAMFRGDHINVTEDRPVLHVALRMPRGASLVVDGVDVVAQVHGVLDRMGAFAERVRSGAWTGHTGRRSARS